MTYAILNAHLPAYCISHLANMIFDWVYQVTLQRLDQFCITKMNETDKWNDRKMFGMKLT